MTESYSKLPSQMLHTTVKHMLPGEISWVSYEELYIEQDGTVHIDPNIEIRSFCVDHPGKGRNMFRLSRTEDGWKLHISKESRFNPTFCSPTNWREFIKVDEIVFLLGDKCPFCSGTGEVSQSTEESGKNMRIYLLVERILSCAEEYIYWIRDAWDEYTIDSDVDSYEKAVEDAKKQSGYSNVEVIVVKVPNDLFQRAFPSIPTVEGVYCGVKEGKEES